MSILKLYGRDSVLWLPEVGYSELSFDLSLTLLKRMTPPSPTACNDNTSWMEGRLYARSILPRMYDYTFCGGGWIIPPTPNDPYYRKTLTGTIDGGPDPNNTISAYAGYIWWTNLDMNPTPACCWNTFNGISKPYIAYEELNDYVDNYRFLAQKMIDNYNLPNCPAEYKVGDPNLEFYKIDIEPKFYQYVNYQGYVTAAWHQVRLYYYDYECATY